MQGRHAGGVFVVAVFALLHPGCGGDATHRAGLASACRLNSDCAAPLVCTSSLCHSVCVDDRDCVNAPCVSTPEGKVCRLSSDTSASDAGLGGGGGSSGAGATGSGGKGSGGATSDGGASGGTGPANGGAGGAEAPDSSVASGGSEAGGAGSGGLTGSGGSEAGGASAGGADDGGSGSGGAPVDAGPPPPPPSCIGGGDGLSTCGPGGDESCCTSLPVTGGSTFYRSYDGVTTDHTSQAAPAIVSDYRLDKFEITIGRYRKFKAAWDGGYRPATASGRHRHLNGGQGLSNSSGGGNEAGWDGGWAGIVDVSDTTLGQCPGWSPSGTSETHPMPCMTWYEAYAFCIWDGGFLPSEAEWNYAAAGGTEHRIYPWSSPADSTTIDSTFAAYCGTSCTGTQNVGSKPAGDGLYGQSDLAGNVWEWTLDAPTDPYPTPCTNCALLPNNPQYRVYRGGGYSSTATSVYPAVRNWYVPETRNYGLGARCARSP